MQDDQNILATLLVEAQQGNQESLQLLCRKLERLLRGYFWNRFHDDDIVDDLAQETYFRLLQNLPAIQEPMKLKNFVLKITFHVTRDYLRQKYRKPESRLSEEESQGEITTSLTADNPHPDQQSDKILDKIDFDTAFATLPEKTQKILLMKADGYRYEEIAEIMDISVSGVKMQIKRNFEKLKKILFTVTFWVFLTTI
ncbi:MAG: sigma-70 family RNA polymerase sigma factor [Calditrichia bacterium]